MGGPLARLQMDESGADSSVLTEHSLWAPSRFVVPAGTSDGETNWSVMKKHTDCRRTLVGRWREALVDTLKSTHSWVRGETCWYGFQTQTWADYIKNHPEVA